jgi:hypothetical protein
MNEMKPGFRHMMLLVVLFAGGLGCMIHGQSGYDSALTEMAQRRPENLVVFTDRTLYAVNETIRFSALLQSGNEPYQGLGSKVLYVELVNSTGTAVAKGKYFMHENRSGGHLSIPSTLLSGLYYLRSYTRWMRNFGSRDFSYIPIRVVNPYSSDVVQDNPATGKDALLAVPKSKGIVSFSLDGSSYHAGNLIDLKVFLEEGSNIHVEHGCLSVVPSGSIDTIGFRYGVDSKPGNRVPFQFNFLPEIHGTSISGIVSETYDQEPASDTRIHFSILGEDAAYFVTRSDTEGRFVINTPLRTGNMEMFVVPEYQPGKPVEVRIDHDFTSEPLPFRPGLFQLSQEEQVLASRMSLHMQLQGAFLADSGISHAILPKPLESLPFYGTPEISVKMDDFVNLPNLEEVIENLIPKTFVVRRGGGAHLMIDSENPMISMFPPLILIDHIPVFDMEVIMAIPPSKLDHIDVIPEVYVLGEVKYGGIISFTSLEGDLASIKLPEGSYFFDYLAYQPSLVPQAARYDGPVKIPDARNTLFWMDQLELREDSSMKVSFQAASVPGTYLILFRGVSSEGDIVYGMDHFEVE